MKVKMCSKGFVARGGETVRLSLRSGGGVWAVLLAAAAVAWAQVPGPAPSPPAGMEILFEARLSAFGAVKPFVDLKRPSGFSMRRDLIAQGEGTFVGPRLHGNLSWSMLAQKPPQDKQVRTLVSGWLQTSGGAEAFFEASGFGVCPDPKNPNRWVYTAALRFQDPDPPLQWLSDTLAVWQGEMDFESGNAWYRAYTLAEGLPQSEPDENSARKKGRAEK